MINKPPAIQPRTIEQFYRMQAADRMAETLGLIEQITYGNEDPIMSMIHDMCMTTLNVTGRDL